MKTRLAELLKQNLAALKNPQCAHSRRVRHVLDTGGVAELMLNPAFWCYCLENVGKP